MYEQGYSYLIHLLNATIHGEQPSEKPTDISFSEVLKLAEFHGVANIAFYAMERLNEKPDTEIYNSWSQKFFADFVRDAKQEDARKRVLALLAQNKIRSIEYQGTVFKTMYPESDWRTMSDLDFIVDEENLSRAQEVLLGDGFCSVKLIDGEELVVKTDEEIYVEIHTSFFSSYSCYYGYMKQPFEGATDNGDFTYAPDPTRFYLYSVLHYLKHLLHKGCGIRRILDLYYLEENYGTKVNKENLLSELAKRNLKEYYLDSLELAYVWFGGRKSEKDFSEIKEIIFDGGIHGNVQRRLINRFREEKMLGRSFPKLRYCLERLFLDKKTLYRRYPLFRKFHLPLGVCWVLRIFEVLFSPKHRRSRREQFEMVKKTKI